ncbi:MAG: DNA sulfur modification protein DndB [Pseudomonadota bacterium]
MPHTIPAIKGKLGSTDFFEATMNVADLVAVVRAPTEIDDWANFSIEERMQREPNLKRIEKEIAPYIARNKDRFFGSMIVLVRKGELEFEPFEAFAKNLPAAYRMAAKKLGMLTINGGELVVLDGQHRLKALAMVKSGDVVGEASDGLANDDVCVIFIDYEDDIKTRRIFNTVNRHARPTARGDNIITSEDDGYAIVARYLMRPEMPFADRPEQGDNGKVVNWKNNTLSKRSTQFITISAIYETIRLILAEKGITGLEKKDRPSDDEIDQYAEWATEIWTPLLKDFEPYADALKDLGSIPALRDDEADTSLLFKPAAQIGLIEAVLTAKKHAKLSTDQIVSRLGKIGSWAMSDKLWQGVIIRHNGTIDAGRDARKRFAGLVAYLIGADKMNEEFIHAAWVQYNTAHGNEHDWQTFLDTGGTEGSAADLPPPIEGEAYTKEKALKFAGSNNVAAA